MYPSYFFSSYCAQCFRFKIIICCRSESFSAKDLTGSTTTVFINLSSQFVDFGQPYVSRFKLFVFGLWSLIMGSNPVRAWNFFQVLFTTTRFSSVLSCEDLLISSFHRSANMWIFIYLKSSCHNYLVKNKVPPSAVLNGM